MLSSESRLFYTPSATRETVPQALAEEGKREKLIRATETSGKCSPQSERWKTGQHKLISSVIEPGLDRAQGTSGSAIQPEECAGADFLARHSRLCLLVSLVSASPSADLAVGLGFLGSASS